MGLLFKVENWTPGVQSSGLRGEEVEVHLIPDVDRETVELRVWWKMTNVQSVAYPFKAFPRVHFSTFNNRKVASILGPSAPFFTNWGLFSSPLRTLSNY